MPGLGGLCVRQLLQLGLPLGVRIFSHIPRRVYLEVSPTVSTADHFWRSCRAPCLMCLGAILLHPVSRVVFGSADDYGGAGALHDHLPPYFRQQFATLEWIGPVLPAECDPLHQRLLAIEARRPSPG